MKLTSSQEEYLKTIYILEKQHKKIRVTDIAKKLNITKPSVNKAINILKDLGLIKYEIYGNIELIGQAEEIAKSVIKKEKLLAMFLTNVLEVEEEQAIKDATGLKHIISKETEEKLLKYINDLLNLEGVNCKCDNMEKEECKNCRNTKIRSKLKENIDVIRT